MSKSLLTYTLAFVMMLLIVVAIFSPMPNTDKENKITTEQQNCVHEFVVVSKYIGDGYYVYSKCYKCGKEIK